MDTETLNAANEAILAAMDANRDNAKVVYHLGLAFACVQNAVAAAATN